VPVAAAGSCDEVITYDDVVLPSGRLAEEFRGEQYAHFSGSSPI
jgi:hypothetical protein